MKKVMMWLSIFIIAAACSVTRSPYQSEITYWGLQITITTLEIAKQGDLAYKAGQAGKVDSAMFYTTNVLYFTQENLRFKDSLNYYLHKP